MLNDQQKRDLIIDRMASWSLEGMEPEPEVLERIRSFAGGAVPIDEAIERAKVLHAERRPSEPLPDQIDYEPKRG